MTGGKQSQLLVLGLRLEFDKNTFFCTLEAEKLRKPKCTKKIWFPWPHEWISGFLMYTFFVAISHLNPILEAIKIRTRKTKITMTTTTSRLISIVSHPIELFLVKTSTIYSTLPQIKLGWIQNRKNWHLVNYCLDKCTKHHYWGSLNNECVKKSSNYWENLRLINWYHKMQMSVFRKCRCVEFLILHS